MTQNAQATNYTYRADGVKVRKLFGDLETDYIDGFQYKSTKPSESNSGGIVVVDPNEVAVMKLRIIPTSEGYYDALLDQYIYNFTDHLGNVRLSYSESNKDGEIQPRQYAVSQCSAGSPPFYIPKCINIWKPGEIVEINNYYPFGLLHNYTATTQNAYQYKYNGKELQETGMYDYGWRQYMPEIGRWNGIDLLSEAYHSFSPYAYVMNNPVMFTDPNGMLSQSFMNEVWGSPSGTTWTNNGSGFSNNWGGMMDNEGTAINYRGYSGLQNSYMDATGAVGGGGGDVAGTILLPALNIKAPLSHQGNMAFMHLDMAFGLEKHLISYLGIQQQPYDRMAWVRNSGGGLKEVNILAVPYMLVEAGLTDGLMRAGMDGESAYSTAQIATFLYAMKAPQGVSGEMGILNKKGGVRIDPENLRKEVTEDLVDILRGKGTPIIRNGVQETVRHNAKWRGGLEWKIRDVPGTMIDGTRIIQHPDGRWGIVINHIYTNIIQIPTSSAVKWK